LFEDQKVPTMNFGWLNEDSDEDEYSRVVLHEFGHSLSCIHEHQHPANGIPWILKRHMCITVSKVGLETKLKNKFFKNIPRISHNFPVLIQTL